MENVEYQKQLVAALQQQRDQANNTIAHLAALVSLRDSEIAELKKATDKTELEVAQ